MARRDLEEVRRELAGAEAGEDSERGWGGWRMEREPRSHPSSRSGAASSSLDMSRGGRRGRESVGRPAPPSCWGSRQQAGVEDGGGEQIHEGVLHSWRQQWQQAEGQVVVQQAVSSLCSPRHLHLGSHDIR